MVTYSELFQFVMVLVAVASLIFEISKKNNRPTSPSIGYFSLKTHIWADRLLVAPFIYPY